MKTGQNFLRRCLVGVLCAFLCAPALAETAAEQLDKAVELFRTAKYEECRELLAKMDAKDLTPQQAQRRTELAEEVATAINRSSKAQRDLQDAERALEAADLAKAADFFKGVEQNEYASPEQKERARNGLALIQRRQDLEKKLQEAPSATQPAEAPAVAATRPAAEKPQTVGADRNARLERDRALAAQAIEVGNDAIRHEQYDLGERKFQEALRLVPEHPSALEGLQLVRQHREVTGQPNLLDKTQQRQRANWQRTEVLYRSNENEIRQAINEKEFAEASRKLEVTRRLVEAGREDAQPPERYTLLIRELDAMGRFIDEAQKDFEQAQAAQQRAATRGIEQARLRRDEQDRQERISKLLEQAMQLQKEREYEKAADILREILAIDPTFQHAEWMLSVLYDANLIKNQLQIREKIYQQVQQALHEAEEARTPELTGANNRVYAFPSEDEWRIISQRDPYTAGVVSEDEANRATRDRLKEIVPSLDFPEGTSFEEVLNALREMSKLSIDVNWNALGILGIDRATDTLGIRVTNVKYETILGLLLANVGGPEALLDYDVRDGVVRISTKEDLDTFKITRVYDVSDLLIRLPSFRARNEQSGLGGLGGGGFGGGGFGGLGGGGLGGLGGGGFGGGGFGGGGFGGGGFGGGGGGFGGQGDDDDDASEEQRQEIIEDLEEMIKEQIEPDTWEPEGTVGSLRIWNDRMIVRHTSRVHQEIQELFKELRDDAQSLQVAVESKVVQLRSNFLEQIGVDLDVVLNQGNAGLDNSLVEGVDGTVFGRDPVTGVPTLMPRRFTQLGFYPDVPAYGVPMAQTALGQPYTNVALVPPGNARNYWSRHTTPVPILNNSLGLAAPRTTGIPGSLAGDATSTPAFQIFGSFLDNIQVDFLLRATQMDARSSIVDSPRLVTPNNRGGYIQVNTLVSYVAQPGFLPAGGSGVGGQATAGRDPSIGTLPRGRTLDVTPTVSADRKYVTLTVRPRITDVRLATFAGATGPLQVPEFDLTEIRTSVNVPDRGWVLLGGLKLAGETEVEAGVPMLSKIPVLKRAFTNRSKVKDEFVTLFLLKPTIIIQGEQERISFDNLISADNGG